MSTRFKASSFARPVGTLAEGAFFITLVTLLMVWLAGGFKEKIRSTGISPAEERPYSGLTAAVRRVSLPLTEEAVGSVKPMHEMVVTSRVAARITELQLTAGQQVSADEVLVRLDDRDLKARVAQAKAALDAARATRDQAIIDRERLATAYAARAASKVEFDHADLIQKNAESDLARATEAVNEAQAIMEYTTIRAPAAGVVVDRKVNVGDTVMPGQVLATLYDPSHMQLVASVRETLTQRLKVGQEIAVRLDALHLTGMGTIAEIVPEAESASRTFQVKVTGNCPPGIYSGMFGRIIIPLDARDALLIPSAAVGQVGQLNLVDSVKNSHIERRIVRLGRLINDDVEVLSGLQEGEQVVLRSASTLPAPVLAGHGGGIAMIGKSSGTSVPELDHHFTNGIVQKFLYSNLSLILIVMASLMGLAALIVTPREEDPQIVVPLADVYVSFPGHSAGEVEQLVATPLEKVLYQIDGVEYVYSMSRQGQAIVTVRYYVGEDRERSLVKLHKKIDENLDIVPPGVTGWVIKPVEIDDVPVVTLTLTGSSDEMAMRRVAEEMTQRLAAVKNVSRAYVVGGLPRVVNVYLQTDAMAGYGVSPLEIQRAIAGANVSKVAGDYQGNDKVIQVEVGSAFADAGELRELVVAVSPPPNGRPVFLKDVARIEDGPAEATSYVRHGWGPGRGFQAEEGMAGTKLGQTSTTQTTTAPATSTVTSPAVTIAIAKKKGANAVWVARDVLQAADELKHQIIPSGMELVVTRNYGLTANEKVNDLVEGLAVAIFIVIALLTMGLGWRESLIVALAVPVVFGLTLSVNLLCGFTINRVTLFALIVALGLLVDDPIVDVENISRHFALRRRATRRIVMEAVAEIRPPLITATLAVMVSFLPMFFITGMMGPYMRPMALNVPVAMLMSMVVAFTITPWLAFHVLKRKKSLTTGDAHHDPQHSDHVKQTLIYRVFYRLLAPLLNRRPLAWSFLATILLLTGGATYLVANRSVPFKLLPFDNKNELLLVVDADQGTTLERTDAAVREFERYLAGIPEVTDFTSYVGVTSPMDFNGLVRHYYLKLGANVAEIRLDLVAKKNRSVQSHALGLQMRNDLTKIARQQGIKLKIVEVPPGPPVLASIVAEVYGQPDSTYDDLLNAADVVHTRLSREPGVVDTDNSREAPETKQVFVTDKEKAALHGIRVEMIASTLQTALGGASAGTVRQPNERNPLLIELRLPQADRSSAADLAQLRVKGSDNTLVPLAELGQWKTSQVDQTVYHKNLQRVAYIFADTAGRPPADVVVDVQADRRTPEQIDSELRGSDTAPPAAARGFVDSANPKPLEGRTFLHNGSGVPWAIPDGIKIDFTGEGEWKITLDVFRDLGLAFGAALVMIYILLAAQTRSFMIPLVVMMAIPLTVLGVMPGFWLLNHLSTHTVGPYSDSVLFTATGMIGMIALSGIVTRNSIILVDFIHLSLRRGRSLFDAIMETCAVRLRPILLTAAAAMLSALPIILDPIYSGLAWTLIFGLFASALFTLFVIPVSYWLLYAHKPGHGLSEITEPAEPTPALAAYIHG